MDDKIYERFRPKYDLWNANLDIPFHALRQRVKAIAQRNLAAVANATVCGLEDVP